MSSAGAVPVSHCQDWRDHVRSHTSDLFFFFSVNRTKAFGVGQQSLKDVLWLSSTHHHDIVFCISSWCPVFVLIVFSSSPQGPVVSVQKLLPVQVGKSNGRLSSLGTRAEGPRESQRGVDSV